MSITPEELIDLPTEAFNKLVNEDVRGDSSTDLWEALRHSAVIHRWYDTLVSMKRESERQLANYKNDRTIHHFKCMQNPNRDKGKHEYQEWIASKAKWRNGVLRFKTGVEEKIAEAKTYLRLYAVGNMTENERTELVERINKLESGIKKHETEIKTEDNPSDADVELWDLVS